MAADTPASGTTTWPAVFTSLLAGQDLSSADAAWAMDRIMSGEATPAQVAGFLVALRAKGETVEEMRGLADMMLQHANRIEVAGPSLDIVGTGGDRAHTVNISTMASIVCAAAGIKVVKHGNRAASSSSGSADVLEALGVNLTIPPERVVEVAERAGITFCFAQTFHPSFRHTAAPRRDLGIGTAFNALGPLTNPAQPTYAAVGVADARLAPLMAGVFAGRGKDAVVFRGDDSLDELTVSTTSSVWWVRGGVVREYTLDPRELGLELHPLESLRGGDAVHNAGVVRDVFGGQRGPVRDAVVLNAGIALALTEQDPQGGPGAGADAGTGAGSAARTGMDHAAFTAQVRAGMDRAERAIDEGAATEVVARWVAATRD
ncbi:anthranilate phosphoribosyltransferase [Oryzihumus leptocrescens]|uniref:Anthranilate phosphoribosyltransferase n=1 Tax=Oryzihumus leptocrescens TaxID=297536 RepID=A0A542ZJN0_9MICO|nr:anthranilate phosphoribosyltransferase [Oryzihumus leptocrescens]TQL60566.1 anthranilate phosphoribosyltransferase [Oryzihumus leptocrescens]